MLAAAHLLGGSRTFFVRTGTYAILKQSRASYIRGHWPEPITQPTIDEFLSEINYFDDPKKLVNIGIQTNKAEQKTPDKIGKRDQPPSEQSEPLVDVDKILDLLGEEAELPSLDINDSDLDKDQLMRLAMNYGIYRDLFGQYIPDREHIRFTQKQAERLYKLVPYHWITDQPFARVERKPREPDPIKYFEPVVRISARFVNDLGKNDSDEKFAHTSYHGNMIPACDALVKPSITLDGSWHALNHSNPVQERESQFDNWQPGQISFANMPQTAATSYHSLLLLNLDSLHENAANLHWMAANITSTGPKGAVTYDEVCDYLPVHGIRGFGYSRYVFLALQHDAKLDTADLNFKDHAPDTRKFDAESFLKKYNGINMLPVGLSWFQTVWDDSSNRIFHEYMKMRAPVYEHVQHKLERKKFTNMVYPGRIPFNVFLDHLRDPKEIEEKVLLDRLKGIDPFDYKDQYVKPRVPPTVFEEKYGVPTWMQTVLFKRKNRVGYFRGLRPASATLPLNNNADLDAPIRPIQSSIKNLPSFPNQYPSRPPNTKRPYELEYKKPESEQRNIYVQRGTETYLDQVKKMMENLKKEGEKRE